MYLRIALLSSLIGHKQNIQITFYVCKIGAKQIKGFILSMVSLFINKANLLLTVLSQILEYGKNVN